MAVSITHDLTTLYDANTAFGGGSVYSGFQRFGSGCNGSQVSQTTSHFTGSVTSFSLVGKRIFTWLSGPAGINTMANGGYRIVIGDGTNTRAYYVGGRDVPGFFVGGWQCFTLDGDALPADYQQIAGSNEPNLSALTLVGIGFNVSAKATGNSPNVFWDVMRVGTGLTIGGGTGGDPGTFAEIHDADASTSNAWGVFRQIDDGVYGAQGRLTFGSVSAASVFRESDALLFFEGVPSASGFYRLEVIGSASHANEFTLGQVLGIGEDAIGIAGVTIQSARPWLLDVSDVNAEVSLYGCTVRGATDGVVLGGSVLSTLFNGCGQVDAGSADIRLATFSDYAGTDGALLWNTGIDVERSSFSGNSRAIEHDSAGSVNYVGLSFSGNTYDIHNSSGGALTVNAVGGSNPATFINSAGGSTTIENPVLVTITANISLIDAEIRIYDLNDDPPGSLGTELAGVEHHNAANFNYAGQGGNLIWIQIMQDGYVEFGQEYTIPETDSVFTATLQLDVNA